LISNHINPIVGSYRNCFVSDNEET